MKNVKGFGAFSMFYYFSGGSGSLYLIGLILSFFTWQAYEAFWLNAYCMDQMGKGGVRLPLPRFF